MVSLLLRILGKNNLFPGIPGIFSILSFFFENIKKMVMLIGCQESEIGIPKGLPLACVNYYSMTEKRI
jgi:hypothetical protein